MAGRVDPAGPGGRVVKVVGAVVAEEAVDPATVVPRADRASSAADPGLIRTGPTARPLGPTLE